MTAPARSAPSSPEPAVTHREWIATMALALLAHGFLGSLPPAALAQVGTDWADLLERFDRETILEARRRWLIENPDRRPAPGHIRRLCQSIEAAQLHASLTVAVDGPTAAISSTTPEQRAARREFWRREIERQGLTEVFEARMLPAAERVKRQPAHAAAGD